MADFYLKDPDLALPTANRTATVIVWTVPTENLTVTPGGQLGFKLRVPAPTFSGLRIRMMNASDAFRPCGS